MNSKTSQNLNQPGDDQRRFSLMSCLGNAGVAEPACPRSGNLSIPQFYDEFPDGDDQAAAQWFIEAFWPSDKDKVEVRCPRCAWSKPAKSSSESAEQPYRCPRCRRTFSIKTETVMAGSPLTLRQWARALHIWTEGQSPCSSRKLQEALGLAETTALDVTYRILKAAQEELPPLREPAEMAKFSLGGNPKNRHKDKRGKSGQAPHPVTAIALVGRVSGRTVIETMPKPTGERIWWFLRKHLVSGMDLWMSNSSANRAIQWDQAHLLSDPKASHLLVPLRKRIRTWLIAEHNWVSPEHMPEYLAGLRWFENHRSLNHRERMRHLAQGMMWKEPPPSTTEKKRRKRAQSKSASDGAGVADPPVS